MIEKNEINGGVMNDNGWKNKHGSRIGSFFILLYSLIILLADLQIEIFMIFSLFLFFSCF